MKNILIGFAAGVTSVVVFKKILDVSQNEILRTTENLIREIYKINGIELKK